MIILNKYDGELKDAVKLLPPGCCPNCKKPALVLIQRDTDMSYIGINGVPLATESHVNREIRCLECSANFDVYKLGIFYKPLTKLRSYIEFTKEIE